MPEGRPRRPPWRIRLVGEVPEGVQAVSALRCSSTVDADTLSEATQAERALGFDGSLGKVLVTPGAPGAPAQVLVGLGPASDIGPAALRQAAATLSRAAAGFDEVALDWRAVSTSSGGGTARAVQAAVEGLLLGTRQVRSALDGPASFLRAEPDAERRCVVVVPSAADPAAAEGLRRGLAGAEAVWFARDVIDTPAGRCTPEWLAHQAAELARRSGCTARLLSGDQLEAERLGGLLGVARGSARPPWLVEMTYLPEGAGADKELPTVVLVGKGITFDSGGLSLKTGQQMELMKIDMSGAAAVIACLGACRAFGVPVRVVGITPLTENMPGGRATKPGDVLVMRNGKTVEVLNTDAEGRLVLADCLAWGAEHAPVAMLDIATLTGGCITALGAEWAGLMANDRQLTGAVLAASTRAGEPCWQLPLPPRYRRHLESEVADLRNISKRRSEASAVIAGLFLEEFVGGVPWVHLDIAGPSWSEDDEGEFQLGGTGFGIRLFLELLSGTVWPLGAAGNGGSPTSS